MTEIEGEVTEIEEEKNLGVVFDPTMSFSKHIGHVAAKANKVIGVMIKRSFEHMDKNIVCTRHS